MTTATENPVGIVAFGVATRAAYRQSYTETVSNLGAATAFRPVQLNATGWVRKLDLGFTLAFTTTSAAAVVAGDAPFNTIAMVSLNDPTGKPIFTPITGYQLYLMNKYLPNGSFKFGSPSAQYDPTIGPDFAYAVAGGTTGTAKFYLSLDFEVDPVTHYGCIPNLDANASLLLQVNVASSAGTWAGTTQLTSTVKMDVYQDYWMPTGNQMGSVRVQDMPPGAGDYLFTSVQTAAVAASAENLVNLTGLGGVQQGIIAVSRASGTRTAFTAASNVGLVYDNTDLQSSVPLEVWQQRLRREYGLFGADMTTAYIPNTVVGGVRGLDAGVLVWPFQLETPNRDQWFRTKTGAQEQLRITPGASATQLEIITRAMQVNDAAAFYATSR